MKKTLLSIGLALVAGITTQAGVHKYQNGTYSKSYRDGSVITLTPRFGGGFNIYQAGPGYTSYGVAIPRWDGGYNVYKNMNGRVFYDAVHGVFKLNLFVPHCSFGPDANLVSRGNPMANQ